MNSVETEWWTLSLPPEWWAEREGDAVLIGDRDDVGYMEITTLLRDEGAFTAAEVESIAQDNSESDWQNGGARQAAASLTAAPPATATKPTRCANGTWRRGRCCCSSPTVAMRTTAAWTMRRWMKSSTPWPAAGAGPGLQPTTRVKGNSGFPVQA